VLENLSMFASSDNLGTIESCEYTQFSREEYYVVELSQSLRLIDERATVDTFTTN
jgi:hypothetical protein